MLTIDIKKDPRLELSYVLNQDEAAVHLVASHSSVVPSNTTTQGQTTTTTTGESGGRPVTSKEPFVYFDGLENARNGAPCPAPVKRPELLPGLHEQFPWPSDLFRAGGPLSEECQHYHWFMFGGARRWGTTGTLEEKFYAFKHDGKTYLWLSLTLPHKLDALFQVCGMDLDALIEVLVDAPWAFLPGGGEHVWVKRLVTKRSGNVNNEVGKFKVGWLSAALRKLEAEFNPPTVKQK